MTTKKGVIIFAVIFLLFYALIYIVPTVSDIFRQTYIAEYGTLDVSRNVELNSLECSENLLKKLDLRNNSQLTEACCVQESLKYIYVTEEQKNVLEFINETESCQRLEENKVHKYAVTNVLTKEDVEVSFNSNGGSKVAPISVKVGEKYGSLPTPTREGYTFGGWFHDGGFIIIATCGLFMQINVYIITSITFNYYAFLDFLVRICTIIKILFIVVAFIVQQAVYVHQLNL